jgi:mono/diheme cytochrome c family protein
MKVLAVNTGIAVCLAGLLVGCAAFTATDIGKNEFQAKCATCHGVDGKGDGPQAKVLPTRPADLTLLAKHNGGVFPVSRVHEIIDGRLEVAAHGSRLMPVWGDEFLLDETRGPQDDSADAFAEREARVNARVQALVDYLQRLQE